MSKVLENRKSSFALATKKEIELTHLISIAFVRNRKYESFKYSITCISAHLTAICPKMRPITGKGLIKYAKTDAI